MVFASRLTRLFRIIATRRSRSMSESKKALSARYSGGTLPSTLPRLRRNLRLAAPPALNPSATGRRRARIWVTCMPATRMVSAGRVCSSGNPVSATKQGPVVRAPRRSMVRESRRSDVELHEHTAPVGARMPREGRRQGSSDTASTSAHVGGALPGCPSRVANRVLRQRFLSLRVQGGLPYPGDHIRSFSPVIRGVHGASRARSSV